MPIHDGLTFTGWNTKSDGTGDAYRPGDTLTVTGDTTLYAQWKRVPETTLPDTGGYANHAPLIVGGGVTAAALALAVVARRRAGRHAA